MYDDILSSNDDDIFEEKDYSRNNQNLSKEIFDSVTKDTADVEAKEQFKNIFLHSTIKTNFVESFYEAAANWIAAGADTAQSIQLIQTLADMTNGQFVYQHRYSMVKESIQRRKTILNFVDSVISNTDAIQDSITKYELPFDTDFFETFFRSYYKIAQHSLIIDIAMYKYLSNYLNFEIDEDLVNITGPAKSILSFGEFMNELYVNTFVQNQDSIVEIRSLIAQEFSSYNVS